MKPRERSDYYRVLGVDRDGTYDDIRLAYRRLVKECHPNAGAGGDVELFQRVCAAYEILSDAERRRDYDRELDRRARLDAIGVRRPGRNYFPTRDSWFDRFFGLPRFFSNQAVNSRVLEGELTLNTRQARRGGRYELAGALRQPCPHCDGLGQYCIHCGGLGRIKVEAPFFVTVPPGVTNGSTLRLNLGPGSDDLVEVLIWVRPG